MKVAFILGSGHCGSTLLDLILGRHEKIVGLGEVHDVNAYKDIVCSCGQNAKDCDHWSEIISRQTGNQKIFQTKLGFLKNDQKYFDLKTKKEVDKHSFLKTNKEIYKYFLERFEADIVVDSSKDVDRAELLSTDNEIEVIVIHLYRNSRAVLWSYYKKYHMYFRFVLKWLLSNIKVEIFKNREKVKYIFVKYSKLANNPEKEVRNIVEQMGLEYNPGMLEFRHKQQHQIGGNHIRFGGSEEIKEDIDWKQNMPIAHKILLAAIFWPIDFYYHIKSWR